MSCLPENIAYADPEWAADCYIVKEDPEPVEVCYQWARVDDTRCNPALASRHGYYGIGTNRDKYQVFTKKGLLD